MKNRITKTRHTHQKPSSGIINWNRKELCECFEIPYMTETDWELGNRRVPTYLLRLMEYKIRIEQLADKKNQERTEDKK